MLQPLRLQLLAVASENGGALLQLSLYLQDCVGQLIARRYEVLRGVDVYLRALRQYLAGQRVELDDALHVIAKEFDTHRHILIGGHYLQRVASYTEPRPREIVVVPVVLHLDEAARQLLPVRPLAPRDALHEREVLLRRTQTVDAGNGRDDEHVPPRHQRARGRVTQLVDLVVDVGFLLDVRIGRRNVRLRLVVVVVGDEVLHRVLREEVPELLRQLGRKRLVGRDDDRGLLHSLDGLGHRVRFA